jgi:hypothetical protein
MELKNSPLLFDNPRLGGDGLSNDEQLLFKMAFLARSINEQEKKLNELKSLRVTIRLAQSVKTEEEQLDLIEKYPMVGEIMERILEDPASAYLDLMKLEPLQKLQEDNICLMQRFIELFLCYCLPKALWKRELDLPLNMVEQCLLMELIPYTREHPFWNKCIEKMTKQMTNIFNDRCRTCGKKIKMHCQQCKEKVGWCSIKCKGTGMDGTFEHKYLECKYFNLLKKK